MPRSLKRTNARAAIPFGAARQLPLAMPLAAPRQLAAPSQSALQRPPPSFSAVRDELRPPWTHAARALRRVQGRPPCIRVERLLSKQATKDQPEQSHSWFRFSHSEISVSWDQFDHVRDVGRHNLTTSTGASAERQRAYRHQGYGSVQSELRPQHALDTFSHRSIATELQGPRTHAWSFLRICLALWLSVLRPRKFTRCISSRRDLVPNLLL